MPAKDEWGKKMLVFFYSIFLSEFSCAICFFLYFRGNKRFGAWNYRGFFLLSKSNNVTAARHCHFKLKTWSRTMRNYGLHHFSHLLLLLSTLRRILEHTS